MKKILLCMLCLVMACSALFAATVSNSNTVVQMGAVAEMRVAPMFEEKAFEGENGGETMKKSFLGWGGEVKLSLAKALQLGGTVTYRAEDSGRKHIAVIPSASFMMGGNNFNFTAGIAAEAVFSGTRSSSGEKTIETLRNFPLYLKGGMNVNLMPFGIAISYYIPAGMGFEDVFKGNWKDFKPQWDKGILTAGILFNF